MENEIPQDAGGGDDNNNDDTSKPKDNKPATMKEMVIRLGAIGNFGIQSLNIVLSTVKGGKFNTLGTSGKVGRGMIYGSSSIGAIHSPVLVHKERQLTKEDTFRAALNGIRAQQSRLAEQNNILSAEIDDLQSEVDRMKDVEMALRALSETQGTQLTELMDLINENKVINEGMRAILKSKILEEVISLVLDIDNDGSFTIEDKEIDRLIIGMNLIEEISYFDKEMFRQDVIDCDGNVDEVIAMIKSMIHGTNSSQEGDDGRCTRCTIDIEDSEQWFKKQRSNSSP